MTGKTIGTPHAEKGITGTMKLNAIMDDGTLLTTASYSFASGPYGNVPTPNHNYPYLMELPGCKMGNQFGMAVQLKRV